MREGLQSGAEQWAWLKETPLLASRSIWGVFAFGWPSKCPTQSRKSSTAMNNTLGLPNDGQEAVKNARPTNSVHLITVFIPLEFQHLGNQRCTHLETSSYSSNHVDRKLLLKHLRELLFGKIILNLYLS